MSQRNPYITDPVQTEGFPAVTAFPGTDLCRAHGVAVPSAWLTQAPAVEYVCGAVADAWTYDCCHVEEEVRP